jgi:hypothetical protein
VVVIPGVNLQPEQYGTVYTLNTQTPAQAGIQFVVQGSGQPVDMSGYLTRAKVEVIPRTQNPGQQQVIDLTLELEGLFGTIDPTFQPLVQIVDPVFIFGDDGGGLQLERSRFEYPFTP